jgi:hypothetical protein
MEGKGNVADRFRLAYLKSTGFERADSAESFSSYDSDDAGKMVGISSPLPERSISETFSSEAILKQAKADLKHPDFAGRSIVTQSFVPGVATVQDGHGHGTHCIGTSCGPLTPPTGGTGRRYGIAHGATIWSAKY